MKGRLILKGIVLSSIYIFMKIKKSDVNMSNMELVKW